jgi:hypothetical protein
LSCSTIRNLFNGRTPISLVTEASAVTTRRGLFC